ncbi:hypothetical protein [Magnetococcus sp. PR-3]|uniref:hypothetical protein n=1 Tax=Magnetococcus sp. PR-3 TaxID=3120355 RepID=UPI002FCE273D
MHDMHPIIVRLEPGEYRICHCGDSLEHPLCDRQQGPVCRNAQVFSVEKSRNVPICQCGRTETAPVCDGAHGYSREERARIKRHNG